MKTLTILMLVLATLGCSAEGVSPFEATDTDTFTETSASGGVKRGPVTSSVTTTSTSAPTDTATFTETFPDTNTKTDTQPTNTGSATNTDTVTASVTNTVTASVTNTVTSSTTATETVTLTATATNTNTNTNTNTVNTTPTLTATSTYTTVGTSVVTITWTSTATDITTLAVSYTYQKAPTNELIAESTVVTKIGNAINYCLVPIPAIPSVKIATNMPLDNCSIGSSVTCKNTQSVLPKGQCVDILPPGGVFLSARATSTQPDIYRQAASCANYGGCSEVSNQACGFCARTCMYCK